MGSKADGHLPLSWYGVFAVAAVAPSAVVLNALIGVAVGCMRRAAARNAWSPWAGWETRGGDIWHEHVGARVIGLVCVTEGSVFRCEFVRAATSALRLLVALYARTLNTRTGHACDNQYSVARSCYTVSTKVEGDLVRPWAIVLVPLWTLYAMACCVGGPCTGVRRDCRSSCAVGASAWFGVSLLTLPVFATLVAWADGAPFRCAGRAVPPRRVPWFQCAACARLRAGFTLHSFIPWFVMDALVVGAALLAYSCQIVAVCAAAVQVNPKGTPCYVTVYQVCKGDADDADEFVGDGYVKPSMLLCVFFVPVAALTLTPIQIVLRVSEMRADM